MSQDKRRYAPDEIMMLGMDCLAKKFGLVNAELFINSVRSVVRTTPFGGDRSSTICLMKSSTIF